MPSNSKIVEVSTALKAYLDTYETLIKTDDKSHSEANSNANDAKSSEMKDAYNAKSNAVEASIETYTNELDDLADQKIGAVANIIGDDEDAPANIAGILTIWGAIEQAGDEVDGWKAYLENTERDLDGLYDTYLEEVLGNEEDFSAAFVA